MPLQASREAFSETQCSQVGVFEAIQEYYANLKTLLINSSEGMALQGRCSYGDLGALCEFERLIDNPFRRDGAPRSVFLWRLGSNMFRIIGHTGRCRAGFPKHIAPRLSVRLCDLRFMQVLGSRRLRLLLGRLFPNPPPPEWHDITAAAQLPAPPPF